MTEKQQKALDYFVGMGWTPAQAAGIVANLIAESNLNPEALGDGGRAYGIAQWHPDRQANFQAVIGRDIRGSTLDEQLAFVHAEMQSTEKPAGDALRACTSAAEAGATVSKRYERPADTEGEASRRARLAETLFAQYAGPPDVPALQPKEKKPMFPLLLPALLQVIPQLAGIFGAKGEKVAQMSQVAEAVTQAITTATGTANLQAGLEAMTADPAAKAQAVGAVLASPPVAALLEAGEAGGGGIAGARKAAADPSAPPFYTTGPFWISLLLLGIVYAVLADVLFLHPVNWTPSDRSQMLMLAVAVTSGVMGYFLGSSIGSQRKDQLIAGRP